MAENLQSPSTKAEETANNAGSKFPVMLIAIVGIVLIIGYFWMTNGATDETPTPETSTTTSELLPTAVKSDDDTIDNSIQIEVSGGNFYFEPNEIRVQQGAEVTIVFSAEEGFHDWVVDNFDAATEQITAGNTSTVTFTADLAGEYEFYCSVGNHRAQGMVGTLIVE